MKIKDIGWFFRDMGYLLYKLLSNLGEDIVIYRCSNCYTILKLEQKKCYRCGREIIWEE